jgi:hypothetical protein
MKRAATGLSIEQQAGADMERRTNVRYALSFPVLFRWQEELGEERQGGGFSRDVSTGGIYVSCDRECPAVNTKITVEVLVPSAKSALVALKLTAQGEVVRVNKAADGTGFGASVGFALEPLRSMK